MSAPLGFIVVLSTGSVVTDNYGAAIAFTSEGDAAAVGGPTARIIKLVRHNKPRKRAPKPPPAPGDDPF